MQLQQQHGFKGETAAVPRGSVHFLRKKRNQVHNSGEKSERTPPEKKRSSVTQPKCHHAEVPCWNIYCLPHSSPPHCAPRPAARSALSGWRTRTAGSLASWACCRRSTMTARISKISPGASRARPWPPSPALSIWWVRCGRDFCGEWNVELEVIWDSLWKVIC